MSTDAPFTPPKKKPNVLWWLAGGFAVLVFVFFLQLFGPNPPIVVSPQTTHITSPLGPNGLPDYERYLLEKSREGVTPENNAAALIWQALWPGELDPPQYAAVAAELGLEKIPASNDSLVYLYGKANQQAVRQWLLKAGALPAGDGNHEDNSGIDVELIENTITQAMNRPWTSDECPPLAKWVADNKKPLDMLVEASHRTRCYFPSPSLINREQESLIQMLLPGVQSSREAGRALATRAMWHLGEGRAGEAWQDLLAVHRIGRLVAQGPTLVEQLVGIAIDGIAREGTLVLLDQDRLSPEQARQIQADLESLTNFNSMADSLDSLERMSYLDAVTLVGNLKKGDRTLDQIGVDDDVRLLSVVSVDWNVVLRKGNEYYDRYAAAARMTDRMARDQAVDQIERDLRQLSHDTREPAALVAGVISPRRRSEIVASAMLNIFLPALDAATNAQDRANAQLELLRLAAALAVYRAEHGAYPEKLEELAPSVLDKLPVDLYNAKPFFYKRTDDGYLLYTAGENGIDDGGSSEMWRTLHGQPVDQFKDPQAETMEAQIPDGADDIPILVPTPKWQPPKPPATNEP